MSAPLNSVMFNSSQIMHGAKYVCVRVKLIAEVRQCNAWLQVNVSNKYTYKHLSFCYTSWSTYNSK